MTPFRTISHISPKKDRGGSAIREKDMPNVTTDELLNELIKINEKEANTNHSPSEKKA